MSLCVNYHILQNKASSNAGSREGFDQNYIFGHKILQPIFLRPGKCTHFPFRVWSRVQSCCPLLSTCLTNHVWNFLSLKSIQNWSQFCLGRPSNHMAPLSVCGSFCVLLCSCQKFTSYQKTLQASSKALCSLFTLGKLKFYLTFACFCSGWFSRFIINMGYLYFSTSQKRTPSNVQSTSHSIFFCAHMASIQVF